MDRDRLVMGLAAVFAGCTVTMTVLAFSASLFLLVVAVPFGLATYLLWYHASGRLEARARRRASRARRQSSRRRREPTADARSRQRARTTQSDGGQPGMDRQTAFETLGVAPDASQETIHAAYRERVKQAHPDSGGDEETFKRVNEAYERLSE